MDDIFDDMPSSESVHESKDFLQENDSFPIVDKRVPSKTASNDLSLQNCFESLSSLENVVVETNCTTQVELALDNNVISWSNKCFSRCCSNA